MTQKQKISKLSFSKILLFLIGILTPASYLIGTLFYQGLMSGYGVDSSNFPIDIHSTYVYAYFAVLNISASTLSKLINYLSTLLAPPQLYSTLFYFFLFSLCLYALIKIGEFLEKQNGSSCKFPNLKIVKYLHWKNNAYTAVVGILGFLSGTLLSTVYAFAILVVLWWGIPYSSFIEGEEAAHDNIIKHREKGCYYPDNEPWNTCAIVLNENNEILYKGISVAEGSGKIAIIDEDGSHVFALPKRYEIKRLLKPKNNITNQ